MNGVIEVRYWRDEPAVIVPPELAGQVTVKLVDTGAEDQFVLKRGGVSVYHAMKDLDMGPENTTQSDYWFATRPYTDWEAGEAFDIRDLPSIPEGNLAKYQTLYPADEDRQRLAYAVDIGEVKSEE